MMNKAMNSDLLASFQPIGHKRLCRPPYGVRSPRSAVFVWSGLVALLSACASAPPAPSAAPEPDVDEEERAARTPAPAEACEEDGSCYQAGARFWAGLGVARDEARAAYLFGRACDGGDWRACSKLGMLLERRGGGSGSKDAARAAALFHKACNGGDASGCVHLGRLSMINKDEARALSLLKKAADDPLVANAFQYFGVMHRPASSNLVGQVWRDVARGFVYGPCRAEHWGLAAAVGALAQALGVAIAPEPIITKVIAGVGVFVGIAWTISAVETLSDCLKHASQPQANTELKEEIAELKRRLKWLEEARAKVQGMCGVPCGAPPPPPQNASPQPTEDAPALPTASAPQRPATLPPTHPSSSASPRPAEDASMPSRANAAASHKTDAPARSKGSRPAAASTANEPPKSATP
jgi:hypothetical protein